MIRPGDWTILSRNERAITASDRHFFASRCNGGLWVIDEHDVAPGGPDGMSQLDRPLTGVPTRHLSAAVEACLDGPKPVYMGHQWFTQFGTTLCYLCHKRRPAPAEIRQCTGAPDRRSA